MVFAPEAHADVPARSAFAAPCSTCGGTFSDDAADKFTGSPVNTSPFVPSKDSYSLQTVPLVIAVPGWPFKIFRPSMQGGPEADEPMYAAPDTVALLIVTDVMDWM